MLSFMRIRDLKIYILKNEYDKYIKILHYFRDHIHKLLYYNLITNQDKSLYLNELTDIHKLINDYYNDKIINFCEINNDITHEILNSEIHHIISYVSKMRMLPEIKHTHELYFDSFWHPLSEIKHNIKKLANNIGFPTIKIAIEIIMNDHYEFDSKTKLLIENYNYLYIPYKYYEKDHVEYNSNIINNYDLFTNKLFIREITSPNLFIPNFELVLKNEFNNVILKGIFIPDEISLFMRSSVIVFNQLFLKRKYLETLIVGLGLGFGFCLVLTSA
jgi:hypothetical protein